ncbi:aspartate/glutamate racemase family protein [Crenalkalicoccus roseus]|uniref:aspartate/glutamate racemase family protein n=1 Tax=Crenalkalicoccus roseus TaxID=1485588 RepID=UPI0010822E36|nr:aspartate/glutamate racemase family protein [Crenalkalicoccus roseus]
MGDRILVINPNSSASCTAGIAAALAPFAAPGLPRMEVMRLEQGPPAIATWRDWHGVAEPLCRLVEREQALAYVIACASDPGLEAARTATARPVLGMLRCAVAAALARAERFGIVGFLDTSRPRQLRVLQAMGVEARLAGYEALNLPMETLTDPHAPRERLRQAARTLAGRGAEAVVLGCAGLAGHVHAAEDAAGLPVIEPCRAAGAQALLAALSGQGAREA